MNLIPHDWWSRIKQLVPQNVESALRWGCWGSLIAFMVCHACFSRLPWESYEKKMSIPFISLSSCVIFYRFCLGLDSGSGFALFGVTMLLGTFASPGSQTNLDSLRKEPVIAWTAVVVVGLFHDKLLASSHKTALNPEQLSLPLLEKKPLGKWGWIFVIGLLLIAMASIWWAGIRIFL